MFAQPAPRTAFFAQLDAILAKTGQKFLGAFAQDMFARVAWEDIAPYSAEDIALLVQNAWAHMAANRNNAPSIRIYAPELPAHHVHVLELVNTNRPFIFDSVMGELASRNLTVHLVAHPVLPLLRNGTGECEAFENAPQDEAATRESFIHIHIDPIEDDAAKKALITALELVLRDVEFAVDDWKLMLARLDAQIASFKTMPPPVEPAEAEEALAFMEWLRDNNFTLLGLREYAYVGDAGQGRLEPIDTTGLGILRDPAVGILRRGTQAVTMTDELQAFINAPQPLIVSKANSRARVHRHVHMDYVGIKIFDSKGALSGELRLTGLFTSTAYTRSVRSIPFIRAKAQFVLDEAGFAPDSHSGKSLLTVLENFPRDELFQLSNLQLYEFAIAVLQLEERPRIRVLARRDKFERFISVLAYVPRERITTEIRLKIGEILAEAFGGRVSIFTPSYTEGALARLQFVIGKPTDVVLYPEQAALELAISNCVRSWHEHLLEVISHDTGADLHTARGLHTTWGHAFDAAYQQDFSVFTAQNDIKTLEKMRGEQAIALDFFSLSEEPSTALHLRLFHKNSPIALSERVPMLENMGFRVISERTYTLRPVYDGVTHATAFLHDMLLTRADGTESPQDDALFARLERMFNAVWDGVAENDLFNALCLKTGLEWREIAVLRAIARYLRQIQSTYTLTYMAHTMCKHHVIARDIVALFTSKFNPDLGADMAQRTPIVEGWRTAIVQALTSVSSLDEDRILRRFLNVIEAMLRTNYYQETAADTISFKLNSSQLDHLPKPVPMAEIWVYSPRVEGVHLRFGRIARGGLRWSDRPQDFRTEVLGLVKAQQVKNAVIVPVGAKGGFFPKKMPENPPRDVMMAEGTASYIQFVSSLLAITDNRAPSGEILPPANVIRYDGDDPYLVVAADKGTATFSDTANGISATHEFWLGDAFASGGSVGYDHKKMGITARGGWEAVKRHFREINIDIQITPFTVAGVGDMSGDVFGNAMLLSRAIKLVAAFDHRDIFLDPNPDIETSFNERDRMFKLPRSSWADYNAELISTGGGVFSRTLKSIPISDEVAAALGVTAKEMTPDELMNAILKAPVDLMWFGGIGTYIRSTDETDAQVGDRANDSVRITAPELRAKVVGEGANLGLTQRSRIELAQHGVRLNTDAIDNSAGVNSSDVEVNIKIALEGVVRSGRLSVEDRNILLASMTTEVAHLVLSNNYRQTLAVSIAQHDAVEDLAFAERLMLQLEATGQLDRVVEYLPSSADITRRASIGTGLTRPEIAVLLAYSKLSLKAQLLTSDCLDDPALTPMLLDYFPHALQEAYPQEVLAHGLRREIIATKLVNLVIDRGGFTIVPRMMDQTGTTPIHLALAFALAWQVFEGDARVAIIDSLDNTDGIAQLAAYARLQNFMRNQTLWFIRNERFDAPLETLIATYTQGLHRIHMGEMLPLSGLDNAPELIRIQQATTAPMAQVINTWTAVSQAFLVPELLQKTKTIASETYHDTLAQARMMHDITRAQHNITRAALQAGGFSAWQQPMQEDMLRIRQRIADELKVERMTLARLAVISGFITDIAPQ